MADPWFIHFILCSQTNTSVLGDFCNKDDLTPKLCDHSLLSNRTRFTRPCNIRESYVSSSNELTLELSMKLGSILYPLNFLLRYEFVKDSTPVESAGVESFSAGLETDSRGVGASPRDCFKRYTSRYVCSFRVKILHFKMRQLSISITSGFQ